MRVFIFLLVIGLALGKTLYEVLGVQPTTPTRDIRTAYQKLMRTWHPDRNPNNRDEAVRMSTEINR